MRKGLRLVTVLALTVTPLGLSGPVQARDRSVSYVTHQTAFQSATTQQGQAASRSRTFPPRFFWKTEDWDISRLSGLPVEVGLTYDRNNRPWIGLHLNEGLDEGARVVVTRPQDNLWSAVQDLGPAWNEARLAGATSPTGAAFAWRSAEDAVTLARLTRSMWEATSVRLPPEWFEDHWGRSGLVLLPNLSYMLTISQRTHPFGTGFAITWPEGASQASVTRFQAPEDLAGRWDPNSHPAWTAWITNLSDIRVAYFKTNTATPTSRGDLVTTRYDPATTQWSAPELAVPGVVGVHTLQRVTRSSEDVLIYGSKDNRFGQISQVEVARSNGATWSSPSIIENTTLYSIAAPVASGPICVLTQSGGWTYDAQGNLHKLAGNRSRAVQLNQQQIMPRRWSTPLTVFQTQLNACISTGALLGVVGDGYSTSLRRPGGGFLAGSSIATSGYTTGLADMTPSRVRYSSLQYQLPQAPGPVTSLRIDRRTRLNTTVKWDPPQVAPYPNARYQVRIITPGSPRKWGRNISHRRIVVPTPRPGARYTFQVKAVNTVGDSVVQSIRFKS